jgi:hypothetical protein
MIKRIWKKNRDESLPWLKAVLFSIGTIFLWLAFGKWLSSDYFDNAHLASLKVLTKGDVLAYMAVLFAIQIPVFILFLQSMTDAGFINRKVLPRVTGFKEVLVLFITVSFLILFSPRASYLYFPVVTLLVVNIRAIYAAVTVIFEPERYQGAVKRYISKTVKSSFALLMQKRENDNRFYKDLEENPLVEYSIFDDPPVGKKKFELRARVEGTLQEIDLELFNKIVRKQELDLVGDLASTDNRKVLKTRMVMVLRVLPSWNLKKNMVLGGVFLPDTYTITESVEKQLHKVFKIVQNIPTEIRWLNNLEEEFEESLTSALSEGNVIGLQQTLEILQIFLEGLDEFISSNAGEGYTLKEAQEELKQFAGDGLSKHITYGFELLSDLMSKAVRTSQSDMYRELIRFVYRNVLSSLNEENVTTIARFDLLLFQVLGGFLYQNSWNKELSSSQNEMLEDVLFKIKEHTGTLVYQLGELRKEALSTLKGKILKERFYRRISDLRNALLGSIKSGNLHIFQKLISNLTGIDRDIRYEKLEDDDYELVRCNILMLAAYLKHKGILGGDFGIPIVNTIKSWPVGEFLEILVQCSAKNYADSWRVDTHDLPFDGDVVMREVPDYNNVLKSLWVEMVLGRTDYSEGIEYYSDQKQLLESTLFFTGGQPNQENNEILSLIGDSNEASAVKLKNLTKALIRTRLDWESQALVNARIDGEKVDKYSKILNNSYLEKSIAQRIFKQNGSLVAGTTSSQRGFTRLGVNTIFDKEPFIKDWHSGYVMDFHGEQLGSGIAEAQDVSIFTKLLANRKKFVDLGAFHKEAKAGRKKWAVIANGISTWGVRRHISKILKQGTGQDKLFIKGIDQILPIQVLHANDLLDGIYLVNTATLGSLVQKTPIETPIEVDISAYSQNSQLLTALVANAPGWLTDMGNKVAQKVFLKKKTRMLVDYCFKFRKASHSEVLFYPIESEY